MTYSEFVDNHNTLTSHQVSVVLQEDYDVPEGECYIGGWFNPLWEECGEDTPILIEVAVRMDADIEEADEASMLNELLLAVNHEFIHWEQYEDGRYIKEWSGEYEDNPNEIEAYARESKREYY